MQITQGDHPPRKQVNYDRQIQEPFKRADVGGVARPCPRTNGGLCLAPELVRGIDIELPFQGIVGHDSWAATLGVDRLGADPQTLSHLAQRITPIRDLRYSIAPELFCEFVRGHRVLLASKFTKQGIYKSRGYSLRESDAALADAEPAFASVYVKGHWDDRQGIADLSIHPFCEGRADLTCDDGRAKLTLPDFHGTIDTRAIRLTHLSPK